MWALAGTGVCLIIAGVLYLSLSNHGDATTTPPAGSIYYKGVMASDIESAARDPRNHKGAAASKIVIPTKPAGP